MPYDVFISYARSGSGDRACRLAALLEARGISTFLDRDEIAAGDVFPARIADGLLDSRLFVAFIDDLYFARAWCAYEFQVAVAPYRNMSAAGPGRAALLDAVVLAVGARQEGVYDHLPPPLAQTNWPPPDAADDLAALVADRLGRGLVPLRDLLAGCGQDIAVQRLRSGALLPAPAGLAGRLIAAARLPPSLHTRFVGRAQELWRLFHLLETGRLRDAPGSCLVVGTAGLGKTQMAAEYAWRYAPHYPGGVVWINADMDDRGVEDQLRNVLRAFDPGRALPAGGDRHALDNALDELVGQAAAKGRVLWVVDNIPAPRPGRQPPGLAHWCPARNVVDLLCTSRGERHVDLGTVLRLDALAPDAAVELITQPTVERTALTDIEWRQLVGWVGCLPLALRILHASLAGFSRPQDALARATGAEPSSALDAEVQALREDIPANALRGVADTLHHAYEALCEQPALLRCAHRVSWLAPVPTSVALLDDWASQRELGQLANRGWIDLLEAEPGQPARCRMHRVVASFLRTHGANPEADLHALLGWLQGRLGGPRTADLAPALVPHASRLLEALGRHHADAARPAPVAVRDTLVQLAALDLADPGLDVARVGAATLLSAWGEGDRVIDALRRQLEQGATLEAYQGATASLPVITTAGAAAFCADLLRFQHPGVRDAALGVAHRFADDPAVARPLIDAIFDATDTDRAFDELPDRPSTSWTIPGTSVVVSAPRSDGRPQKLHWDHPFWHTVRGTAEREALISLALHPKGRLAAIDLGLDLAGLTGADTLALAARLGLLLRAMSLPVPARMDFTTRLDPVTGEPQRLASVRLPILNDVPAELYAPLVALALADDRALVTAGVKTCLWSQFGSRALSAAVHAALGRHEPDAVLPIAETVLALSPGHLNGHWWRGLALSDLGRDADAVADFGCVLGQQPGFFEARLRRAAGFMRLGDGDAAHRELDLAARAPEADLQGWRSGLYLHLDDLDQALEAADTALRADPELAYAWLARARVFQRTGDLAAARADTDQGRRLGGVLADGDPLHTL